MINWTLLSPIVFLTTGNEIKINRNGIMRIRQMALAPLIWRPLSYASI